MEIPICDVNGHTDLFLVHASATMDTPKTPGERIRWARKRKRTLDGKPWRQEDLAKATHGRITQSSISSIESGETKEISGPNLIYCAAALGVRPEWIITGEEPIEPALTRTELRMVQAYRTSVRETLTSVEGNRDEQESMPGQLPLNQWGNRAKPHSKGRKK